MGAQIANDDEWGDEKKYFAQGPEPSSVQPDAWWVSIVLFYLTLPFNLIFGLLGAFVDPICKQSTNPVESRSHSVPPR